MTITALRATIRSRTFPGIAAAKAMQWGGAAMIAQKAGNG